MIILPSLFTTVDVTPRRPPPAFSAARRVLLPLAAPILLLLLRLRLRVPELGDQPRQRRRSVLAERVVSPPETARARTNASSPPRASPSRARSPSRAAAARPRPSSARASACAGTTPGRRWRRAPGVPPSEGGRLPPPPRDRRRARTRRERRGGRGRARRRRRRPRPRGATPPRTRCASRRRAPSTTPFSPRRRPRFFFGLPVVDRSLRVASSVDVVPASLSRRGDDVVVREAELLS